MFGLKILHYAELAFMSSLAYVGFLYAVYTFLAYLIYRCLTSHYFYQVRSSIGRDLG